MSEMIDKIMQHWFWWGITAACVVWYSTITVYVAIRGVWDIRSMLRRLKGPGAVPPGQQAVPPEPPRP